MCQVRAYLPTMRVLILRKILSNALRPSLVFPAYSSSRTIRGARRTLSAVNSHACDVECFFRTRLQRERRGRSETTPLARVRTSENTRSKLCKVRFGVNNQTSSDALRFQFLVRADDCRLFLRYTIADVPNEATNFRYVPTSGPFALPLAFVIFPRLVARAASLH